MKKTSQILCLVLIITSMLFTIAEAKVDKYTSVFIDSQSGFTVELHHKGIDTFWVFHNSSKNQYWVFSKEYPHEITIDNKYLFRINNFYFDTRPFEKANGMFSYSQTTDFTNELIQKLMFANQIAIKLNFSNQDPVTINVPSDIVDEWKTIIRLSL